MSLNSFTQEGQIFLNFEDITYQEGQRVEDFGLDKKSNLTDEMGSAWSEAKIYWEGFTKAKEKLSDDKLTTFTRERWIIPLLQILGYKPTFNPKAIEAAGKQYVLSHSFDENPDSPKIHIVKFTQALDKKQESLRFSPHAAMQNFLNDHEHLWGIVTNGLQLRLLRDSTLIGHSSYLEINLEQIMSTDGFAEFMILYRIFHRSRFSITSIESDNCWLEKYFQKSLEQGGRVREALSFGVEKAIKILGTSLLFDENNKYLQDLIEKKELDASRYYRSILNLIYKMLFLMVAESRNLLFVGDDKNKKSIFDDFYSFERLRELSEVLIFDSKDQYDLWESFKALLKLLDEKSLGSTLGLGPVDGGLFSTATFELLKDSSLKNEDLIAAIRELSLYEENRLKKRVNYSALDVEELGSVYEGLLEFHPVFEKHGNNYAFTLVIGSERKSTASYYTGADLVEEIIASTLDPLIEEKRKSPEPEKAILALKVIDPACGSGHFLLAATRRIARALSEIRAGEDQPTPEEFRHAKREVVANCIHGVDLNPLAVDLCRVALWIESYESGRPLSFLDHKIKCGNSLIGILSLSQLEDGIPSEAYTAIASDNKKIAKALQRQNENELIGFQNFLAAMSVIPIINLEFKTIEETVPDDVHRREQEYFELRSNDDFKRIKNACDLWTGAFLSELSEENRENVPTTNDIKAVLEGKIYLQQSFINNVLKNIKPLHWPIEFPDVVNDGGFDVVIGNPPYDKISNQKYFKVTYHDSANLFSMFIERVHSLHKKNGSFGFVVPLTFAVGKSCSFIREQMLRSFSRIKLSHYSIRPSKLFADADQRITLIRCTNFSKIPILENQVLTTKLLRWRPEERQKVISNPEYGKIENIFSSNFIPKVSSNEGVEIFKKITSFTFEESMLSLVDADILNFPAHLHTVARYWLKMYDFIPHFKRENELEIGVSTKLKTLYFVNKSAQLITILYLNSSLSYFYWIASSAEFDVYSDIMLSVKKPQMPLDQDSIDVMQLLVTDLMDSYREHSMKKSITIQKKRVEYEEFYPSKSLAIIHRIDDFIGRIYGLSNEEIVYLKDFDIKFRVSAQDDE